MPKPSVKTPQSSVAIVGASFSGLRLAETLAQSESLRVVVFEKRKDSQGVWSTTEGSANSTSRLQIESYVYCPSTCLYPTATEIAETLDGMAANLKEHSNVQLRYGCQVTKISESDDSYLELRCLDSNGRSITERFSSVHVRSGTLSRPHKLHIRNLGKHFSGRWCLGIRNNLDKLAVKGRKVCIVGLGAFAVENAKRAIELGAESVTFIARSESYVAPRYLMHQSSLDLLDPAAMWLPKVTDERWQNICDVLKQTPKTDDYDFSSRIIKYQGKDHFLFTCTAQSDWFYAALTMEAVTVVRGTVVEAQENSLIVSHQDNPYETIEADIVVLCTGHVCDTSLISDFPFTGVMFGMNGKLTHNLNVDKMPNPTLFGPRCAVPHFPALSYGLVSDFVDTLTLHSIVDPKFYDRFTRTYRICQHPEQSFVDKIDGRDWIKLFHKCLVNSFPFLGCRIYSSLLDRRRACCEFAKNGLDWYSYSVNDWNNTVSKLQEWRKSQGYDCSEPLPKFPWLQRQPRKPTMRRKWIYVVIYFIVACLGVERAQSFLEAVPFLQDLIRMIL